jgi:hypothetical protein
MQLRQTGVTRPIASADWVAVHLLVSEAPSPAIAVQVCPEHLLRLSIRDNAVLWARIVRDYYGYEVLVSSRQVFKDVLPPISFDRARSVAAGRSPSAIRRTWAHAFADWLASSASTPLHNGDWILKGAASSGLLCELGPEVGLFAAQQPRSRYVDWDRAVPPMPLRELSAPGHARVRAWRKLAKTNELPPVLLYWVSGLSAYVILDGHDRLHAAALENVPAPALKLQRVRSSRPRDDQAQAMLSQAERLAGPGRPPGSIDSANRLAVAALQLVFDRAPTRATLLEGGTTRWVGEGLADLDGANSEMLGT